MDEVKISKIIVKILIFVGNIWTSN